MTEPSQRNRYSRIIEHIFFSRYHEGANEVEFRREEFEQVAQELGIRLPKNLGDIVYSLRYRTPLPPSIIEKAPTGHTWVIRPAGRARYKLVAIPDLAIIPSPMLAETKVPDATPGLIAMYALNDEQALLAKLRYNRLIDTFTGITCYSLQNHLRTTVPSMGQVEFEESQSGIVLVSEKHYRLVPPDALTPEDLNVYRERLPNS